MRQESEIGTVIEAYVQRQELAGAAALVWRAGEVLESVAAGWRDIEAGLPMTRDTIFRIASMSMPVTSLAAMILMERGAFALQEPIANWAHEFTHMRVLRSPDGPLDESVAAARPITFEDLLTHRAGLTYGNFHRDPLRAAYALATGGDIDSELHPDDWITRLAELPLINQPGAAFHYGCSIDLLGLLLARISGESLSALLLRLVFAPLGMKDTGFVVAADKRDRRAGMYGFDSAGALTRYRPRPGGPFVAERPENMAYVSGGAGLWSTLDDYLVFARLFLGDGAVGGVRLLRPETLALMTTDRLTENQRTTAKTLGMSVFGLGHGFGMGVAVLLDPAASMRMRGRGGIGTVGWPGAYGSWWQADPTEDSVMIFLTHNIVELDQMAMGIGLGAYWALTEFQDLATAKSGFAKLKGRLRGAEFANPWLSRFSANIPDPPGSR
jgi:CubicO group peptidase (beta-lactamase class C family)